MSQTTDTPTTPEEQAFRAFLTNMPVKLTSFVEADLPQKVTVTQDGAEAEKAFLKDYSPGSLVMVENYAIGRLQKPEDFTDPRKQRFIEGLVRYVGEVFLRSLGGEWDVDPSGETTGDGVPFVRPDAKDGECAGEPVHITGLVLRAAQVRDSRVFATALADTLVAGFGAEGAPFRTCTGIMITEDSGNALSPEEEKQLLRFLPSVEPGIAQWVKRQEKPELFTFDRDSLVLLGRLVEAAADQLLTDEFWHGGAARYLGETLRKNGFGTWRVRGEGPYVVVGSGAGKKTYFPGALLTAAETDPKAPARALDEVLGQG
ncbi:hypothetical protein [Brevibacterium litoralis]|uniref:hypothetical protein n=1 Tax=Brevibacterium litoralis TaxID=3138935 RepID=UPI0032EF8124